MTKRFLTRRTMARFLLPLVTIWAVTVPQQAYAFVAESVYAYGLPEVVAGGASPAAAVGAVDLFAGAAVLALGAYIGYVAVDNATHDLVRIPTRADLPVPPPSAAPVAQLLPGHGVDVWCTGSPCSYSPPAGEYVSFAACDATTHSGCWSQPDVNTCANTAATSGGQYVCRVHWFEPAGCPAGYTEGAGVCNLSNARTASPDKSCDYARSGSSLSMISDPDCAAAMQPTCDATGCHRVGIGPDGLPRRIAISPRPDGGSTVDIHDERLVGNTNVVDHTTIGIAPDGTVDAITGGTGTGTVPTDGTAPTPTDTAPVDIQFPSDYARTGEAQVAANTLAPKIDRIGDALETTTATTDPTEPLASDMPWFGTAFNSLSGWTMPGHVSACPQPSLDLSMVLGAGHVYVMSDHCTLFNDNVAPMRAAAVVGWMILALFVFLRA